MPVNKEILGLLAVITGFIGTTIYIVSIFQGKTRPHFFTHIVWFILSAVALSAQIYDKAGPGAWATCLTTLACLTTALLALKWGEKDVTLSDKIALAASLFAIIPWIVTKNPLMSVILILLIETVSFYPTIRKSWNKPYEESMTAYTLGSVKLGLSFLALTNITWSTALYIGFNFTINSLFIAMCLIRRIRR